VAKLSTLVARVPLADGSAESGEHGKSAEVRGRREVPVLRRRLGQRRVHSMKRYGSWGSGATVLSTVRGRRLESGSVEIVGTILGTISSRT